MDGIIQIFRMIAAWKINHLLAESYNILMLLNEVHFEPLTYFQIFATTWPSFGLRRAIT
jgi:hypothetical protein